jgi:hypothetical protein
MEINMYKIMKILSLVMILGSFNAYAEIAAPLGIK